MERKEYLSKIDSLFRVNPVLAVLGPRQCGKTTLARLYAGSQRNVLYLDLEKPSDLAQLESPTLALKSSYQLIVIDEVQRGPDLFPILRVLVDQAERRQRFLILGSASRDLLRQSSESLAGRISFFELTPFSLKEVGDEQTLWLRGGFPLSYLAGDEQLSYSWREAYISTYLERDVPSLGFRVPAMQLRRFWMMLTHYHGSFFNAAEIGRALGVSHTAINNYLGILTGSFMVRQLLPWFENIGKRQVKSPKIYFRDSGILHTLMNVPDMKSLQSHPKLGLSWEGFAMEEVIRRLELAPEQCFFWAVHAQAELDLLVFMKGKRIGFEMKYSDAPTLSTSMKSALELLKLDELNIIYPGVENFSLSEKIHVRSLADFARAN